MNVVEAITVIEKLESLATKLVALTPEENPGLKVHRKLRTKDMVIFVYVDRLELIKFIRERHRLFHKSCTLNSKVNPGDIQ